MALLNVFGTTIYILLFSLIRVDSPTTIPQNTHILCKQLAVDQMPSISNKIIAIACYIRVGVVFDLLNRICRLKTNLKKLFV